MAVVSLVRAKRSAVTVCATAMTLAHPQPSLLVEGDTAGGSVRFGLLRGLVGTGIGMERLAAADRQDALPEAFERNLRDLDEGSGHRKVLLGFSDPRQAAAMGVTWERLAALLTVMDQQAGFSVLVDAGQVVLEAGALHPVLTPADVVRRSDVVLLVVPSVWRSVVEAKPVADALLEDLQARGGGADSLGLLVVQQGASPHPTDEISRYLRAPVLGLMPWDPRTAAYLSEGGQVPRGFEASPLMRAARSATDQVRALAERRRVRTQWGPAADSPVAHRLVQQMRQRAVRGG
ncbi:hypothetical protein [Streptomyces xiamenensis]|uniref:hypothetical protein n=1 Tax=Streptomyces xiamenensis TaxID=408015 RepID=UPI0035D64A6C